jgi:hypothetical protein
MRSYPPIYQVSEHGGSDIYDYVIRIVTVINLSFIFQFYGARIAQSV